jgi:hypothetical protein
MKLHLETEDVEVLLVLDILFPVVAIDEIDV